MNHVAEKPAAPYEIRVYPGADATFTIYEDDGETYAYEKGQRATVELRWDDKARTLSIGKRQGTFPGLVAKRDYRVVLARPAHGQAIETAENPDIVVPYEGKAVKVSLAR